MAYGPLFALILRSIANNRTGKAMDAFFRGKKSPIQPKALY